MITNKSVELFQKAARELPGYKQFLAKHTFDPKSITSPEHFSKVPTTSKKSYLQAYELKDLVWPADLNSTLLFCSTSGSTGTPYYFPRSEVLGEQYSTIIADFLKNSSYGSGKTLFLNAFGMGVWIGGILTHQAFEIAGKDLNTPLAILPTGYNKAEIFKALHRLSPNFDQTIIAGYPPFIKELVDEAKGEGIELGKLQVRFLFAAEAFTENFRDYVCKKAKVGNPLLDTLNIYGTADAGAMACETPLSIVVRRLALKDPLLFKDLFGQIEKTPTLAQYNPEHIEFEASSGEILLSANTAMPLIRYAVGDHGGVLEYAHIKQIMHRYNIDLELQLKELGIQRYANLKQPFIYVYERSDLSVTLHGIIIYPEFIKECLLANNMAKNLTERFTMATKNDVHHNQFLQVNLEMQKGVRPTTKLEQAALAAIKASLIKKSSEFAEVTRSRLTNGLVQVVLWPNGHPRYFTPDTKQKWVER